MCDHLRHAEATFLTVHCPNDEVGADLVIGGGGDPERAEAPSPWLPSAQATLRKWHRRRQDGQDPEQARMEAQEHRTAQQTQPVMQREAH